MTTDRFAARSLRVIVGRIRAFQRCTYNVTVDSEARPLRYGMGSVDGNPLDNLNAVIDARRDDET